MKLGIIGLPKCGKATVFEALTHNFQAVENKAESRIGTIRVPDPRVDRLSAMYQPKKTLFAQVEYFLPASPIRNKEKSKDQPLWNDIRDCNALIHVIRNFQVYGYEAPSPLEDFETLEQEMIFSDLLAVEKRLERMELEQKRGKKPNPEEISLLHQCKHHLENDTSLRKFPELAGAQLLKGFAFITAKPMLVLFNNDDEDNALPDVAKTIDQGENGMVIRGKLEQELGQMAPDEIEDFLSEFNISESAMDRVIQKSYELLGLISFFTVGDDEVRAWTIKSNTSALDAAGAIHTDFKKGFIRAEVVAYDDLIKAGSHTEAKKQGTVRLEGKTYEVKDGDIINFRFNV